MSCYVILKYVKILTKNVFFCVDTVAQISTISQSKLTGFTVSDKPNFNMVYSETNHVKRNVKNAAHTCF